MCRPGSQSSDEPLPCSFKRYSLEPFATHMLKSMCCMQIRVTMLRLQAEVKQYKWGQLGSTSLVADLASNGEGQVSVNANEPYAELWMGSHVSGPSVSSKTGEPLNRWLERNPLALGKEVLKEHGSSLPFLFKVLSIQKSLSIQSHPDKALAEQLHATRPNVYKDPNHKPEIALAVWTLTKSLFYST